MRRKAKKQVKRKMPVGRKKTTAKKRRAPQRPPAAPAVKVAPRPQPRPAAPLDGPARDYVRLCFALARHDPASIANYFGSPALRDTADAAELPVVIRRARELAKKVAALKPGAAKPDKARQAGLLAAIQSLAARAEMLNGRTLSFDREAEACFGFKPPRFADAHFRAIRRKLDAALPGKGTLAGKLAAFDEEFRIGRERLREVLPAVIREARRRTQRCFTLPGYERFELEYVADQPWEYYAGFRGDAHSVLQVNTDRPLPLASVLPLVAGAGYPGCHARLCRAEADWYRQRRWSEYSIELMYSPRSLMAAALAAAAVGVVFPGEEQADFERRVLGPLAGFVPQQMERYQRVQALREGFEAQACCEAGRRLIDRKLNVPEALDWLAEAAAMPRERAALKLGFLEHFRSYGMLEAVGRPLIDRWLERKGGTAGKPIKRWSLYAALLAEPVLPEDIA